MRKAHGQDTTERGYPLRGLPAAEEVKVMENARELTLLSPDKALTDPKEDRLGYSPFARHLADSLCRMSPPDGLVVAIYGPWGSGKTTLLNFLVHFIGQNPEEERPVTVPFNPWWFSGHEDLTRRFFGQLRAILTKRRMLSREVMDKLGSFADLVSEVPIPYASSGAKMISRLVKRPEKDVTELKQSLEDALRKQDRRVLVVIDDIDRLTSEEIRQLFRVVKAVADFPNVIYLMAFDRAVVTKALEGTQGVSGEAYLEKIVQAPFELPRPDKTQLRRLLFERLHGLLADVPTGALDMVRWGNVFLEGIDHFICTPRDIFRLTNTLGITYPAVKGEVNPIDFICVETLRVFSPVVYNLIRENPEMFTGSGDHAGLGPSRQDFKKYHDTWLQQIEKKHDIAPLVKLLQRVFPRLESVWGNMGHGAWQEPIWRKDLRVCSEEIFPVYFRLALPESSMSSLEIRAILSLAADAKSFSTELIRLANQTRPDGSSRVAVFLERLWDFTQTDIHLDAIPSLIHALFGVGDQLIVPGDERRGMFGHGNDVRIGRVMWQLLKRLDQSARTRVLRDAMAVGNAIQLIVKQVLVLGQQQGKYAETQASPESEWMVSKDELGQLEALALGKVRDAARDGRLLQAPRLPLILDLWKEWAGAEEVRQWVGAVVSDGPGLVGFLEKFLNQQYSQGWYDSVGKAELRLDPKWLEPYLDPSQIIERIRRLSEETSVTENQKAALDQFIREYDMGQAGKNPNNPLGLHD